MTKKKDENRQPQDGEYDDEGLDTAEFTPETAPPDEQDAVPVSDGDVGAGEETVVTLSSSEYEALRRAASERDEIFSRLQRAIADFQNLQKRVRREQETFQRYALQDFCRALLPVIDNIERGVAAAEAHGDNSGLVEGIRLVYEQFHSILEQFGISPIDSVGRPFDSDRHEAVMQEESDEAPPMSVLREVERGYLMHERVLRPAKVVVAAGPPDESKKEAPDSSGEGETDEQHHV